METKENTSMQETQSESQVEEAQLSLKFNKCKVE